MSVLTRAVLQAYVPARTVRWPDHSRLFVVGDDIGWSIDDDSARLRRTAGRLGYDVAPGILGALRAAPVRLPRRALGSLRPRWLESSHGHVLVLPRAPGHARLSRVDEAYEALRRNAARVDPVQVTHDEMRG